MDDGTGTAFLFDRNLGGTDSWGRRAKLTASDAAADDNFGAAVGIDTDRLLVGAHLDDDKGAGSGSVYPFHRNDGGSDNWGQQTKLTAGDGAAADEFGRALAIDKSVGALGAHRDDDTGGNSGSVYVFLPTADLAIEKSGSPDPTVGLNRTLTYTLTVNNLGPGDATDVIITDTLPSQVAFVSASAGCSEANGTVTCNIAKVAAATSSAVTVLVTATGPVGTVLFNAAGVTANELDSNSANDTSGQVATAIPGVSPLGLIAMFALLSGGIYWRLRVRRSTAPTGL